MRVGRGTDNCQSEWQYLGRSLLLGDGWGRRYHDFNVNSIHTRSLATGSWYVLLATLNADTRCKDWTKAFRKEFRGSAETEMKTSDNSMGTMANELTSIKERLQILLDRQTRLEY